MSDLATAPSEGRTRSGASGGPRRRFWIAAALVAALYAASLNNQWAIRPDSATYLAVGRSLAEGRGLTYNGGPAWALPPLVPLLAAACRLLVGPDYWLINATMRLFAVGAALASYALARRLGGGLPDRVREHLAVGVLLLVGTSARFFGNSMPVLTDVAFTFWFMLGLYGFVRGRSGHWGWTLAGSLVMVVAVATRYVGIVLFAGMVLAVLADFRRPGYAKRALAALAGPAVMAAGGALVMSAAAHGPKSLTDLVPALLWGPREQWYAVITGAKARDLAVGLASLPKVVTETLIDQELWWFSLVPAALVAVGLIAAVRRRERLVWVPAVAFVLFLLLVGSAAVAPRYLLPLLPLLGYLLLRGVWATVTWAKARGRRTPAPGGVEAAAADRGARAALVVAVAVCMAVSLPKIAREVYWMRHPRFYEVYDKGEWRDWVAACAYLRERGRPGDVVGTPEVSVVHYLSGLRFWAEPFRFEAGTRREWHRGFAHLEGFPPRVFAEEVAKTGIRFLAIPTDLPVPSGEGSWSDLAMEAIAEVGAFDSPPRRFGNVAVYERAGPPPAAP